MTGMLEWKDTGSLGGTGREMKQPCCPVCQGQLERMELLLGMDETLTESLAVRIKEKAGYSDTIEGSLQVAQPGRLTRPLQMEQPHDHKTLGVFNHPTSVGGTAQQGTGNPRGSWNALMTSSF